MGLYNKEVTYFFLYLCVALRTITPSCGKEGRMGFTSNVPQSVIRIITSVTDIVFISVCLSVCLQDYERSYQAGETWWRGAVPKTTKSSLHYI